MAILLDITHKVHYADYMSHFLVLFKSLLVGPGFRISKMREFGLIIRIFISVFLLASIVFFTISVFIWRPVTRWITFIVAFMFLVALVLAHFNFYRISSAVTILTIFIGTTLDIMHGDGFHEVSMFIYFILLGIGAVLLSFPLLISLFTVCIGTVGAVVYCEITGIITTPYSSNTNVPDYIAFIITLFIMTFLIRVLANGLKYNILQVQEDARLLEEKNRISNQQSLTMERLIMRYQNLYDNIQDIYFETSLDGEILQISEMVAGTFTYDVKSLVGENIEILFTDQASFKRTYAALVKRGIVRDALWNLVTRKGKPRFIRVNAHVTEENENEERRIAGTFKDVTDKILLEGQVRQSQKMDSLGSLAGSIAHDFNNLLQVIHGHNDIARLRVSKDHAAYPELEKISIAASKATDLAGKILAFSRKQAIQAVQLDFNNTVMEILTICRRLLGKNIEIESVFLPELPFIVADPTQVEQIVLNLVVNARDAINDAGVVDGVISVSTSIAAIDDEAAKLHTDANPGNYIVLEVTDNGIGMDQETVNQVFEPFYTTKLEQDGTGLGLSTVYGIIKQNNGFIEVRSKPGSGTGFLIYWPYTSDEE
jgi:PAS domain S-box-containing protein